MIWTIIILILGVWLERRFHPVVKKEADGQRWLHYNSGKGRRNKRVLF